MLPPSRPFAIIPFGGANSHRFRAGCTSTCLRHLASFRRHRFHAESPGLVHQATKDCPIAGRPGFPIGEGQRGQVASRRVPPRKEGLHGALDDFRIEDSQCSISFKGPGYEADVVIDRAAGRYDITETHAGLAAILNDLHKGRDTGRIWGKIIDVSAVLMTAVSLTGLILIFTCISGACPDCSCSPPAASWQIWCMRSSRSARFLAAIFAIVTKAPPKARASPHCGKCEGSFRY
jgi:hypothetical protein